MWEKPQNGGDGKRKRITSSSKQTADSGSGSASKNTPGDKSLFSEGSSPTNGGGQTDTMDSEPQLPVMRHRRASSDQAISPQNRGRALNDASAMAALQRAIQSSPHKFMGTSCMPVEIEDFTPRPTRRILFPSPTQAQGAASKPSSSAGSERQADEPRVFNCDHLEATIHGNKENHPPQVIEDGDHEQSSRENPFLNARSKTPTPSSSNRTTMFKTPSKSPGRLLPEQGDFFSSAAKAMLRPPLTPKRTPTKQAQPLVELTPFTAHLNQLLSEANNGSPGSQSFDFPSLPSLRNTPGRNTRTIDFNFSQFDSQDLLSTDVPMPSSPPAWFGICEDQIEQGDGSLWADYQVTTSASTTVVEEARVTEADDRGASGQTVNEV